MDRWRGTRAVRQAAAPRAGQAGTQVAARAVVALAPAVRAALLAAAAALAELAVRAAVVLAGAVLATAAPRAAADRRLVVRRPEDRLAGTGAVPVQAAAGLRAVVATGAVPTRQAV